MSALLGAAALLAQQPTDDRALARITPQALAARVRACGFAQVRVTDDATLQEDVVVVKARTATPTQLRCTARASLASAYYVQFPEPMDQTYQRIYFTMQRAQEHRDAIAWLTKRGLLARLPKYDPARSADPARARAIEAACGPATAGVLEPRAGGVTVAPDALASGRIDEAGLLCLTYAADVTGYPLGFIGNEAYRVDK